MKIKKAFGIDLGTTTSCCSIFENGKPIVIPDESGSTIIPSIISSYQNKILVGEKAKNYFFKNIENTISNVKRFIGLSYDDFEKLNEKFNYKIIKDPQKNIPFIIINHKGKSYKITSESVSAIILLHIKKQLNYYFKEEINDVVITVPADFSQKQSQATRDAAKIAGLNVIRIIKEPVAAAIAYAFNKPFKNIKFILVFDFGGGTLDISILSFDKENFEVVYTKGDNHLGGEDFDNKLVDYCLNNCSVEMKNIYSKLNDEKKLKFRFRLKNACEKAKLELSNMLESVINIENIINGEDFLMTIYRSDFEEINKDLFNRVEKILKTVFKESKIDKNQISNVLLVGGSSNIPKVKEIVSKFFNNKFKFDKEDKVDYTIKKDELIAKGAAIQAALINKMYDNFNFVLFDKYPKSIGIGIENGKMFTIIPKFSYIPIETKKTFKTRKDNQNKFEFFIYEGDSENVKDNIQLLNFDIEIPPLPAGKIRIDAYFSIDINSVLEISVNTKDNEKIVKQKKVLINLKDEEIKQLQKENEEIMIEDNKEFAQYVNEINSLDKELKKTNSHEKKIELLKNKISIFEKFLNDNYKENDFSILQDEYIYILKLFIKIYIMFLKIFSPSDNDNTQSHINKISFYVNNVNFSNITELFPILQILNNYNINIYIHIIINYLENYYNQCFKYFKNEEYENAKNGFNEILITSKKYNIDEKLGFDSDLKNKYLNIINYSKLYLNRILVNNLIKLGDDILKKNKDEKNYSLAINKYNEALNVIESDDRKDFEYEAKCLSKILYIKYIYLTKDNNEYMNENKHLISVIEQNLQYLDINSIQNEEWYKELLIVKNDIKFTTESKSKNTDSCIQQIENNYKNLKTNEFIDFIIKNYPFQGIEKYKNIKTNLEKNPKKMILELSSNYKIDTIQGNNSEEEKKYNIYNTIFNILNKILNNMNKY